MKNEKLKSKIQNVIFFFSVFIFSFFLLNLSSAFAAGELAVPTITINPDVYYPLDEILYLEGRATQNTAVQIQFQKQGARPVQFGAKSDPNGEWVLAEKVPLEAGDWEVRARQAFGNDKVSAWSNPRVFKVIISGITIGGVNIKFASFALVIFILLIVGVAIIFYFTGKVRRLNSVLLSKEIREAQGSVREGFSELRRDLLDELRLLESSGKTLSTEEISRKDHILRELEMLQKNMEREISDIDAKIGNG